MASVQLVSNYLPVINTPLVNTRYTIKNVNPAFYGHFVVEDNQIGKMLASMPNTNIYRSYIITGSFDELLKASSAIRENTSDTFIENLTSVFSYLRDNNINTDEFQICDGIDMSIVIVAVMLVVSIKCPDCFIKNGKKFYDYVVGYINSHKEYYSMVTSKIQSHPISAFDVLVSPLCDEVVEILKNGEWNTPRFYTYLFVTLLTTVKCKESL